MVFSHKSCTNSFILKILFSIGILLPWLVTGDVQLLEKKSLDNYMVDFYLYGPLYLQSNTIQTKFCGDSEG